MYSTFLALLLFSSPASAADYCAAIRGNGENVAAHWAGLSRMVEENGMPSAMAGGSSATVSMFFVDNVAGNPVIKNEKDEVKKRKKAALLIKSMSEFIAEMGRTEEAVSAQGFITELGKENSSIAQKLQRLATGSGPVSASQLSAALQKFYPLLNPEIVQGLATRPAFFKNEVADAAKVFGKFEAAEAKNLFVRPGLVDFKEVAVNFGTVADFYRGNTNAETTKELESYAEECSDSAYKVQWSDLPTDGCKARFRRIAASYLRKGDFQHKALFQPVGENIKSIPITAIVQGEAVNRFQDLKASYSRGETNRNYDDFKVDFDRELKFGYFTDEGDRIKRGLAPMVSRGDLKSAKFEPLARGNWFPVIATSTAEPGLASLQQIPLNATRDRVLAERQKSASQRWSGLQYNPGVLSAGGWPDLAPTNVLEASGCSRVVYVTRKDAETVFAQQVLVRLTGAQEEVPMWKKLKENNNIGWRVTGATQQSPWNRLYNYGNPQSSFNLALSAADVTYCTDWNRYSPFKGQGEEMEKEAYGAPVFLNPGVPESFRVNRTGGSPSVSNYPGCVPMRATAGVRFDSAPAAINSAQ